MAEMTADEHFDGLTKSQVKLIEYWRATRARNGCVTRADIDPGVFRAHLRSIALMDVTGEEPVCRLAGSELRDHLGMEPRGCRLSELPEKARTAWSLGSGEACMKRRPAGGLTIHGARIHAWLRIPLSNKDGRLTHVMCHDELIEGEKLRELLAEKDGSIPTQSAAAA